MNTKSNKKQWNDQTLPLTNKQNKRQNAPSMTTHFAINVNLCCSWSHLFHWRFDCRCDNSQLNQGCFQIEEIVSKWSNPVLATQGNPVLSSTGWVWERYFQSEQLNKSYKSLNIREQYFLKSQKTCGFLPRPRKTKIFPQFPIMLHTIGSQILQSF